MDLQHSGIGDLLVGSLEIRWFKPPFREGSLKKPRDYGDLWADVTVLGLRSGIRLVPFPSSKGRNSFFRCRKRSSRSSNFARRAARFSSLRMRDLGHRHCRIKQEAYATVTSNNTATPIPRNTTTIRAKDNEKYYGRQARGTVGNNDRGPLTGILSSSQRCWRQSMVELT